MQGTVGFFQAREGRVGADPFWMIAVVPAAEAGGLGVADFFLAQFALSDERLGQALAPQHVIAHGQADVLVGDVLGRDGGQALHHQLMGMIDHLGERHDALVAALGHGGDGGAVAGYGARALFLAFHVAGDVLHQGGGVVGMLGHRAHVAAGLGDDGAAFLHGGRAGLHAADDGIHAGPQGIGAATNGFGHLAGLVGQLLDLVGDDGEALAGGTGPGRLDGGVQGQKVGLARDRLDRAGHGGDLVGNGRQSADPGLGVIDGAGDGLDRGLGPG